MVASEFLMDGDTSHISQTIIDGSQIANSDSASVVYFISGEDTTSVLCGFTIKGGRGNYTAYTYLDRDGGGIWISNAGAKIIHNRITDNIVDDTQAVNGENCYGAGICTDYGDLDYWVVIENNTIDNNKLISKYGGSEGAGICIFYNARIENNTISNNSIQSFDEASGWGGGLLCEGDPAWDRTIYVRNNTIKNNICQGLISECGGAILGSVKGEFVRNLVTGNSAVSPDVGISGKAGGFYLWNPKPDFIVSHNSIQENSGTGPGGGMVIESNISNPNNVLVENNFIIENTAHDGGGFYLINNPATFRNNVFRANYAESNGGAGYARKADSILMRHQVSLINNTISGNQAGSMAGALFAYHNNPILLNSIFWENPDVDGNELVVEDGIVEVAYSDIDTNIIIGNKLLGPGIIVADPQFTDLNLFILPKESLCVDAGVDTLICFCGDMFVGPAFDINGKNRPVGWRYDMGVHEISNPLGILQTNLPNFTLSTAPNPFRNSITISYTLSEPSWVSIQIFDNYGRKVSEPLNAYQPKGDQRVVRNTGELPVGVYYCRLQAGSLVESAKIIKIE